jgi:hypothetical protein
MRSTVDAFAPEFQFDRALDEDPDTYFWGISPKKFDTMDVHWVSAGSGGPVLGKWMRAVTVVTGSKDRPGDQLDYGDLLAAQWTSTDGTYDLVWTKLGQFIGGKAQADAEKLKDGPIVGLRIKVTREQTKWVTIPEIVVVERTAPVPDAPKLGDLPNINPDNFFNGWGRQQSSYQSADRGRLPFFGGWGFGSHSHPKQQQQHQKHQKSPHHRQSGHRAHQGGGQHHGGGHRHGGGRHKR